MACAHCGSERTIRNGAGRAKCLACARSFTLVPADQAAAILEARQGHAPAFDLDRPIAPGFQVKGTSTLVDRRTGAAVLEWVKTTRDAELQAAAMDAAMAALAERVPRAKPVAAPTRALQDELLNQYTITDYHLGMLAWGEETGDDWDLNIAEDMLVAWFSAAIAQAPKARKAVFAQLGDLLHWDGMDAVTPASKHLLDADTRFQKLVRVVIRVMRRVIGMLLAKYEHVHLIMAEGNHDPASSIWLRELLAALYEDEPRLSVDVSPDPYYCVEHGLTSLFYHHGHKRKPANIDDVFAAKFREVFGRTKFSYAHMGHMHHKHVIESNLMEVEQHQTLSASDAFASRGGWMSARSAQVITYHRAFGEVGRVRISSQMLEAA